MGNDSPIPIKRRPIRHTRPTRTTPGVGEASVPADARRLSLSCAVPIIFSPSITRCLFKETGRTALSFFLFRPSFLPVFLPLCTTSPRLPPPSRSLPRFLLSLFVCRFGRDRERFLCRPVLFEAFFGDALPRGGVNFSYSSPLVHQLSPPLTLSGMEFLRFARTLCAFVSGSSSSRDFSFFEARYSGRVPLSSKALEDRLIQYGRSKENFTEARRK